MKTAKYAILIGLWAAGLFVNNNCSASALSDLPVVFDSKKDLETAFAKRGVPETLTAFADANGEFYFVVSSPYSGVDTDELYCYSKAQNRLIQFLVASLPGNEKGTSVTKFVRDGDFTDVVSKGKVVLKINRPNWQ